MIMEALASSIVHEIRQPLGAVMLNSELAMVDTNWQHRF
jgi:hypothetical protein